MNSRAAGRLILWMLVACLNSRAGAAPAMPPEDPGRPTGARLAFVKAPLSARQQAAASVSFGTWDAFKAFSNPSLLPLQQNEWEVEFSSALMYDARQTLYGAAGSWNPGATGPLKPYAAAMVSGWSMQSFNEIDAFGEPTGTTIAPGGTQAGVAGALRWKKLNAGLGLRIASESLAGLPDAGTSVSHVLGNFALAISGVRWDFGLNWEGIGGPEDPTVFSFGIARRTNEWWTGSWGFEWHVASDPPGSTYGGAGVTVDILRVAELRLGARSPGGNASQLTFGAGARVKRWALDYAILVPVTGVSIGPQHMLSIGYAFGETGDAAAEKPAVPTKKSVTPAPPVPGG